MPNKPFAPEEAATRFKHYQHHLQGMATAGVLDHGMRESLDFADKQRIVRQIEATWTDWELYGLSPQHRIIVLDVLRNMLVAAAK